MSAQRIDLSRYPRRSHFEYFRSMAYPYVGLTVQADVTELRRAAAARKGSFFLACLYCRQGRQRRAGAAPADCGRRNLPV